MEIINRILELELKISQDHLKIAALESDLKTTQDALTTSQASNWKMRECLTRIAAIDFRPQKSPESLIAEQCLKELNEGSR